MKYCSIVAFAVLFVIGGANLRAEDAKPEEKHKKTKEEIDRVFPRGPKVDDLKAAGLTDEDIVTAKKAVAEVEKKNLELMNKPEVKAAVEELHKAEAAARLAEEKVLAAKGGFDHYQELKKAVLNSVPEEKKAKVSEVLKIHDVRTGKSVAKTEEKAPENQK